MTKRLAGKGYVGEGDNSKRRKLDAEQEFSKLKLARSKAAEKRRQERQQKFVRDRAHIRKTVCFSVNGWRKNLRDAGIAMHPSDKDYAHYKKTPLSSESQQVGVNLPVVDIDCVVKTVTESVWQMTNVLARFSPYMHKFMAQVITLSDETKLKFGTANNFSLMLRHFMGANLKGARETKSIPDLSEDASEEEIKKHAKKLKDAASKEKRDVVAEEALSLFKDIVDGETMETAMDRAKTQQLAYFAKEMRANYLTFCTIAIPAHVSQYVSIRFDLSKKEATKLVTRGLDPVIQRFNKTRSPDEEDDEETPDPPPDFGVPSENTDTTAEHQEMLSRVPDAEAWLASLTRDFHTLPEINYEVLRLIDAEPRKDLYRSFYLFPQFSPEQKFVTVDACVFDSWARAGKLGELMQPTNVLQLNGMALPPRRDTEKRYMCPQKMTKEQQALLAVVYSMKFKEVQRAALPKAVMWSYRKRNEGYVLRDEYDSYPVTSPATFKTNGVETRVAFMHRLPVCWDNHHDDADLEVRANARMTCPALALGYPSAKSLNSDRKNMRECYSTMPSRGLHGIEQLTTGAVRAHRETAVSADLGHGDLFWLNDGTHESVSQWREDSGANACREAAALRRKIEIVPGVTTETIAEEHAANSIKTTDATSIDKGLAVRTSTIDHLTSKKLKGGGRARFIKQRRLQQARDKLADRLFNKGKRPLFVGDAVIKSTFRRSGSAPVVYVLNHIRKKGPVISMREHNTTRMHAGCGNTMRKVMKSVPRFACHVCKYKFAREDSAQACPDGHVRRTQEIHDYKFFHCTACDVVVHRDQNSALNHHAITMAKANGEQHPSYLM